MKLLVRVLWVSCGVSVSTSLLGAEVKATFTVPVSVGYTDNASLASDDKKESESFWRVSPGFTISARAPRWNASATYAYFMEQHSRATNRNDNQQLSAQFGSEVAENLLFLDANASIAQQRENVLDSVGFGNRNLRDVYSWTIRPALRHQFASSLRTELSVAEYGVNATGSNQAGNGIGERINASVSSGGMMDALRLDLSAADDHFTYDHPPQLSSRDDTRTQTASARATVTLSQRIMPYAQYGYERIEDVSLLKEPSQTNWRAGVTWIPSNRTSLDANYGKRFFGETWVIDFKHSMRRFNWGVSYIQDIRTGRQDFVNPDSLAIFNALNNNLQTLVPDPAERMSLIGALMQRAGVPPLAVLIDRRYLDRNLTTNIGYSTVKSTTSLGFYWRDSDASKVSLPTVSAAVPTAGGDHIRQNGVNLNWIYRAGVRTSVSAGIGGSKEAFPDIGIENRNLFGRLGLSYQLGRHVSGSAEYHRNSRSSSDAAREYTENSILLSLTGSF